MLKALLPTHSYSWTSSLKSFSSFAHCLCFPPRDYSRLDITLASNNMKAICFLIEWAPTQPRCVSAQVIYVRLKKVSQIINKMTSHDDGFALVGPLCCHNYKHIGGQISQLSRRTMQGWSPNHFLGKAIFSWCASDNLWLVQFEVLAVLV